MIDPIGNVINLRKYTNNKDIKHVMYNRQEIENIYLCEICGRLQVIDGVVWHIKPIEEHDASR